MPLYENRCKACGHIFERIQKFSDPLVVDCPKCHRKGTVEQMISTSALRFKGSGWYVNDYASKQKGDKHAASEPKAAEVSGSKVEADSGKSSAKKTSSPPKKS